MKQHAIFAPSSAARWISCPASATLSQGLPQRTNPAAEEGTRVHEVIERNLRTGELPLIPPPWAVPLSEKRMPDHEVIKYIRDFITQLGGGQMMIEERVVLTKGCWGYLDVGHVAPETITIFDYKNGSWDVEAKNNKQLLTYAAMFLDNHPQAKWFRLVVFQPNSWTNGINPEQQEGFKQHVHSRAEVEAHRQLVMQAITYTGPPMPGPHCRWCAAFSRCPAMSQDANFLMAAISRDPANMLPIELLRMLRIIRGVNDMKDLLEAELTSRLKNGAVVDGAELKPMRKWTAWNDDRQAAEKLYQLHGARGVKPVTPAAAKKLSAEAELYVAVASHKPETEEKASY